MCVLIVLSSTTSSKCLIPTSEILKECLGLGSLKNLDNDGPATELVGMTGKKGELVLLEWLPVENDRICMNVQIGPSKTSLWHLD